MSRLPHAPLIKVPPTTPYTKVDSHPKIKNGVKITSDMQKSRQKSRRICEQVIKIASDARKSRQSRVMQVPSCAQVLCAGLVCFTCAPPCGPKANLSTQHRNANYNLHVSRLTPKNENGVTLPTLRDDSEVTLSSLWGHFGDEFGSTLGSF